MTRQHRSGLLASVHEMALDMTGAGLGTFDEMCRSPVEATVLQLQENASQAVFARHLNVTTGLASQWERREKRRRGASLKLHALAAKNGLRAVA